METFKDLLARKHGISQDPRCYLYVGQFFLLQRSHLQSDSLPFLSTHGRPRCGTQTHGLISRYWIYQCHYPLRRVTPEFHRVGNVWSLHRRRRDSQEEERGEKLDVYIYICGTNLAILFGRNIRDWMAQEQDARNGRKEEKRKNFSINKKEFFSSPFCEYFFRSVGVLVAVQEFSSSV